MDSMKVDRLPWKVVNAKNDRVVRGYGTLEQAMKGAVWIAHLRFKGSKAEYLIGHRGIAYYMVKRTRDGVTVKEVEATHGMLPNG